MTEDEEEDNILAEVEVSRNLKNNALGGEKEEAREVRGRMK